MKARGIYLGLSLFLALFLSLSSSSSAGKKVIHIVKKGDTLWSICQQYYGDPYLWPELWEMNRFITNPHWLTPGDPIKLLEYEEKKPEEEKLEPVKKTAALGKEPLKGPPVGIDISSLTDTRALGFFRQEMIEPWGRIFEFKTEKILLGKGDTAYVKMYKEDIKPGDKFTICSISEPVNHPVTGKEFGYTYSFKGILEIERAQEDYHVAKIRESFRAIYKDDLLMPYHPVSSCILPIPCEGTVTAYIVAAKDGLDLHGQYSVVYIDAGHNTGVVRGNLLEAIGERESIADPQKKERVALPPTVLGKILILETTEKTSTGVVFWASRDFSNGVKIRSQTWDKRPRELTVLPECPVE
ncbi:MAG: LysM peptidoglycan-binding domain-containing protein [Desulfobacterales bacterium]|nr:LysM peptidoglycan-binding domain-containing protein [Desulfobacterales bacterium]